MSLYTDNAFIPRIGIRLDRFKRVRQDLYNFRCPFCADSKKNKFKARGYFYRKNQHIHYKCHNCGSGMMFSTFLKKVDPPLYREYSLELFGNKSIKEEVIVPKPYVPEKKQINLPTLLELDSASAAVKYAEQRKIPRAMWSEIYYAKDFAAFVHELIPSCEDKKLVKDEERIIFPFWDEKNNLLGMSGRAFSDTKAKYITHKVSDDVPKIFGLHRLDKEKPIYVVEGQIDSLFLPNCIAAMDASLHRIPKVLGENLEYVFIPDNQPRNKEVCREIETMIETGRKVCLWPSSLQEKDINDMVLSGLDPLAIIETNTYSGLAAKIVFEKWRRI